MITTEPDDFDDPPLTEEPQDLDPRAWLAGDEGNVTGRVSVRGGTLAVGALTQGEMTMLRKQSSRQSPRGGERILDSDLLNRWVISYAMAKGKSPGADAAILTAEAEEYLKPLNAKLTGDLTEVARKILRLSGFVDEAERQDDPFD